MYCRCSLCGLIAHVCDVCDAGADQLENEAAGSVRPGAIHLHGGTRF